MTDMGDALAILRWYAEMGIDAVVDATPHDRFAEHAAARVRRAEEDGVSERSASIPSSRAPAPAATSRTPAVTNLFGEAASQSADAAVLSAREMAAGATTLDELKAALLGFDSCALKKTATQLVFSDGNPEGPVMAVGEAPGADEDRHGIPFVGRSGQLFDRMLKAIGLDRSQVYIANIVPWRPPGNRTPTPQETAICRPFIVRQIELAAPKILLCLGAPTTETLLGAKGGIMRTHGRWLAYPAPDGPIRAMPVLHPAYLLRRPAHKNLAWRDLLALRQVLDETGIAS